MVLEGDSGSGIWKELGRKNQIQLVVEQGFKVTSEYPIGTFVRIWRKQEIFHFFWWE